jgi:L-ascorbate metabolism protein UlaG (beta-lactamase superfamily)
MNSNTFIYLSPSTGIRYRAEGEPGGGKRGVVKITYLGNSCILITSPDGTRIVSDPFGPVRPAGLSMLPGDLEAKAVTVSHTHPDHNFIQAVGGKPKILTEPGVYKIGDVVVTGLKGWEGSPKGPNLNMKETIFVFETAGVKIVQLGDSGVITDPQVLDAVSNADVGVVNIDGYVIPHTQVMPFMRSIKARTVLLAHYSIEGNEVWNGAPTVAEFIAVYAADTPFMCNSSELELTPGMPLQMAVLKPLTLIEKPVGRTVEMLK